ncbi:MAG: three-Cys-motif partner protein TcmP [Chitinispirillia bacterium]|nr:three-Cys-motif partner protein TcmP [Chitinispirillia bacterium]
MKENTNVSKRGSGSLPKFQKWGSDWTIAKLDAFKKYVDAYLTIMEVHKHKGNWLTLYFDGFAGSGDCGAEKGSVKAKAESLLLDFGIEEADTEIYKGAAERVLELKKKFNYYYFIDLDEQSLKKLQERLTRFDMGPQLQFRAGDANKYIAELAAALKRNKKFKALVLLDPFGMQINWESIELLRDTASDVWILVPSGVIINRLLDRKGELTNLKKLCSFFGMTEEEIRKEFYTEDVNNTLFGEETVIQKKQDSIKKIADLYIKKLGYVWKYVTPKPLIMRNTKNVTIFHFVFASNNKTGLQIANDIIGKV